MLYLVVFLLVPMGLEGPARSGGCSNHGAGGFVISCLIFAATCRIADGFLGWPGGLHPGGGTSRRSLATSRVRSTKRSQFDDEGASVKCGGVCEGDERSQRELELLVLSVGLAWGLTHCCCCGAASWSRGACLTGACGGGGDAARGGVGCCGGCGCSGCGCCGG